MSLYCSLYSRQLEPCWIHSAVRVSVGMLQLHVCGSATHEAFFLTASLQLHSPFLSCYSSVIASPLCFCLLCFCYHQGQKSFGLGQREARVILELLSTDSVCLLLFFALKRAGHMRRGARAVVEGGGPQQGPVLLPCLSTSPGSAAFLVSPGWNVEARCARLGCGSPPHLCHSPQQCWRLLHWYAANLFFLTMLVRLSACPSVCVCLSACLFVCAGLIQLK